MKKGIGFAIVVLALVINSCGKKEGAEQKMVGDTLKGQVKPVDSAKVSSTAKRIDTTTASKIRGLLAGKEILFPSTTTITPPGANNPATPTVVRLEQNPAFVFFQGDGQISFPFPVGFSASNLPQIGSWKVTKFTRDAGNPNPVDIQIHVNYDDQVNSFYDFPELQMPPTATKNLYMAFYHGYTNNNTGRRNNDATATLIVGDAGAFTADPPAMPEKSKKSGKK